MKVLTYLSQHKTGAAREIAKANAVNIQIADHYLKYLASQHYVRPPAAAGKAFTILHKGMRYLEERGLLG